MGDSTVETLEWGRPSAGVDEPSTSIVEGRILRVDDEFVPARRRLQERRPDPPANEWDDNRGPAEKSATTIKVP